MSDPSASPDERPGRDSRSAARRWGGLVAQFGVTALVTWFVLDRLGLSFAQVRELDARWWTPNLGWLAIASTVLILGYALSAILWSVMVQDLGGRPIRPRRAVALFMTANLGRYLPGKVWQILGLTYLSRTEGVGARVAGAAAVLGQVFALGGAALVGSASLLEGSPWHRTVATVSAGVVTTLCLAFFVAPIRRRVLTALERWGGTQFDRPRIGAGFGLRWALLYFINWIIYAGAFWLFVMSYEPAARFLDTAPAFAAAYLLGYVFLPAPAGLGIRESAMTGLLAPTLGVTGAFAVAVLSRLWLTVVEMVPAAVLAGPTLRRARLVEGAVPKGASTGKSGA